MYLSSVDSALCYLLSSTDILLCTKNSFINSNHLYSGIINTNINKHPIRITFKGHVTSLTDTHYKDLYVKHYWLSLDMTNACCYLVVSFESVKNVHTVPVTLMNKEEPFVLINVSH